MTTEAGRRLAESLHKLLPNMPLTWEGIDDRIAAIEAEARAALLAELEAGVEGLPFLAEGADQWPAFDAELVDRAAVLDLIQQVTSK